MLVALKHKHLAASSVRVGGHRVAMSLLAHRSATAQQSEYAQRVILDDVVDFAAGQPSPKLLPLQQVAEAAAHRLSGPAADPLLLQYGPEKGYASFRCSLASFLSHRYKVPVAADHLMITAGVSHGLDLVCKHLAAPGDLLLLEQPTYFLAQTIFNSNRLCTMPAPSDEQGIDVDKLEELLTSSNAPKPRLLYVIPVHSNPRGITLPLERRKKLIKLAHHHNFLIVADEVYQLLSFPSAPDPPPPMRAVEAQLFQEQQLAAGGDVEAAAAAISAADGHVSAAAEAGALRTLAGSEAAAEAVAGAALRAAGLSPAGEQQQTAAAAGQAGGPSSSSANASINETSGSSQALSSAPSAVISLGSFSKIMAPGLRLGWVEAAPEHLARLARDGVLASGGSIAPLASGKHQMTGRSKWYGITHSALEQQLLQQHLHGTIRPALERQCAALCSALQRHLPDCHFHQPQGGYFVWLELPQQVDSRELLQLASTKFSVKFAPGPVCQGAANAIRLSFSFYEGADLDVGVQRLAAALQAYLAQ